MTRPLLPVLSILLHRPITTSFFRSPPMALHRRRHDVKSLLLSLTVVIAGILAAKAQTSNGGHDGLVTQGFWDPIIAKAQTSSGGLDGLVTQAFWDRIINQAAAGCAGKGLYTRSAFLTAAKSYPSFGTGAKGKREIAAFLAHATHETDHFCYTEDINKTATYCHFRYPCPAGKQYYGRGPLKLTWNYNYLFAGRSVGFDGINDPELVARDAIISFKTALWYWMEQLHPVLSHGFGATILGFTGDDCNGGNPAAVNARVGYYKDYCKQLGVDPGGNLYC